MSWVVDHRLWLINNFFCFLHSIDTRRQRSSMNNTFCIYYIRLVVAQLNLYIIMSFGFEANFSASVSKNRLTKFKHWAIQRRHKIWVLSWLGSWSFSPWNVYDALASLKICTWKKESHKRDSTQHEHTRFSGKEWRKKMYWHQEVEEEKPKKYHTFRSEVQKPKWNEIWHERKSKIGYILSVRSID